MTAPCSNKGAEVSLIKVYITLFCFFLELWALLWELEAHEKDTLCA